MEPLFDRLLKQKFTTSEEAIDYCQKACIEYGFTVNHESGANRVSLSVLCQLTSVHMEQRKIKRILIEHLLVLLLA